MYAFSFLFFVKNTLLPSSCVSTFSATAIQARSVSDFYKLNEYDSSKLSLFRDQQTPRHFSLIVQMQTTLEIFLFSTVLLQV